jgi:hypothetical protein
MAQHEGKQGEWPRVRNNPTGYFQHPDGILKSTRSLAGPLRLGTEDRVGPKGFLRDGNASDFGMDRVSKRGFDPMGTSDSRDNAQEASSLLSRESRRSE